MAFRDFSERVQQDFNLAELCRAAGFHSWENTAQVASQPPAVREVLESIDGKNQHLFYRPLGQDGIELFTFEVPTGWIQDSQTSGEGLVYFCFPNKKRIELEKDISSRPQFGLRVEGEQVYAGTRTPIQRKLYLDTAFPDKWSHCALEILLAYQPDSRASDQPLQGFKIPADLKTELRPYEPQAGEKGDPCQEGDLPF